MKRLIGRTDMEDALKNLDKLTHEEARMAVAQNLKATHNVDERVRGVANTVVAVDNRVAGVDDRVARVDDRVAGVDLGNSIIDVGHPIIELPRLTIGWPTSMIELPRLTPATLSSTL